MPHTFPLAPAGGLFVLIMGVGVALGAVFPARRKPLLALGGGLASIAIVLFAGRFSRDAGPPTPIQLYALGGAILLEMISIGVVVATLKPGGERTFLLAILLVVGAHFLPMAIALGPLCAALAVAASANAAIGLWATPRTPLRSFWLADGVIKIAFGGLMLTLGSG